MLLCISNPCHILVVISCLFLGAAISLWQIWLKIVRIFVKNYLDEKKASRRYNSGPGHELQISDLEIDEHPDNTVDLSLYNGQENSATYSNIRQKLELSSQTLQDQVDGIDGGVHPVIKYNHEVLKEILKESLDGVYRQVEELIKQNNLTQLKQIAEKNSQKNKETENLIQKNDKDIKEAMKIQHREIRRRLERLEKKANTGYFN